MAGEVAVQKDELELAASTLRDQAAIFSEGRGSVRWFIGDCGVSAVTATIQDLSDAYCATWAGLDDRLAAFADMTYATADAYAKAEGQFGDDAAPNLYENNPYKV